MDLAHGLFQVKKAFSRDKMKILSVLILLIFISGCISSNENSEVVDNVTEKVIERDNTSLPENELIPEENLGDVKPEPELRQEIVPEPNLPPLSPATFYQDGKVIFEHYWPLDPLAPHLKADESEMVVYNDGDVNLQITSTDMKFLLDEKSYSQYSGTWEQFSSRTSWERIVYINIDPSHYKNEPLILQPGQKAKIHYDYKFETDIADRKHAVQINLKYKLNNLEKNLDLKLERTRELYYSEMNSGEEH